MADHDKNDNKQESIGKPEDEHVALVELVDRLLDGGVSSVHRLQGDALLEEASP
jgi:hypothetical protein